MDEILTIVKDYTTPSAIKKLNITEDGWTKKTKNKEAKPKFLYPGIAAFYKNIAMEQDMRKVISIAPFVDKHCGEIFNPKKVKIAEFKTFIAGISRWVHDTGLGMHNFLALKGTIKSQLLVYHIERNDKDPYVKAWYDAGLFIADDEFLEKNTDAKDKVNAKNMNVVYIPQEKAEAFYRSFCFKENPDLIDKIITCQAVFGSRLIEILSSKVSNFKKDGTTISQYGVAKMGKQMKKGKFANREDKVVTKTPIIISSDRFMDALSEVRAVTDKLDLDNDDMTAKYDANINKRIVEYLEAAGIPISKEVKSSHSLRRLYVAFSYSLREEPNITYEYWIKSMLGHESAGSTMNYNSVKITTAKILDKDSAAKLNLTYKNTIHIEDKITKLEEKVAEVAAPAVVVQKTANQIEIAKQRVKTKSIFKKIKELQDKGFFSYAEMQTHNISHNIYAKYKKLHT